MPLTPGSFTFTPARPSLERCITDPVPSSIVMGLLMAGLNVGSGAPLNGATFGGAIGGIYAYHVLQCPMEQVHGRRSSLHNAVSGGTLGGLAVARGMAGVPFVPPNVVYGGRVAPVWWGAGVYGALGFAFATMSGKGV